MSNRLIAIASVCIVLLLSSAQFGWSTSGPSQAEQETAVVYGPYHGSFITAGLGLRKPFGAQNAPIGTSSNWSMHCWVSSEEAFPAATLLAGFGELKSSPGSQRYLAVLDGRLAFWAGSESVLAQAALEPARWQLLAATFDGARLRLYLDGTEAATEKIQLQAAAPVIQLAPQPLPWPEGAHFSGRIAQFTLTARLLSPGEIRALLSPIVPLDVLPFEAGSKPWPVSTRGTSGLRAPQDPATLPKSSVPPSAPVAKPVRRTDPVLVPRGTGQWALSGGWRLAEAPKVTADGATLSRPGFNVDGWLDAVVPGTVLTTFIERGIYPDPDYGLNNLAIPETLNKQDYWYRMEFNLSSFLKSRRLTLTFEGINYAAEIWLNGKRLGNVRGAFVRGIFDVTGLAVPGKPNALAVRVSPPPHPGIPHEQSLKAGAGLNGGMLCLDGPTFICTEGWDWLPGIRDRDTGIWQEVVLTATGEVKIGDVQVVTALPLPDTSRAQVAVTVPLRNESQATVPGVLTAAFEGVQVSKKLTLRPGDSTVTFSADEYPQLAVTQPRLWWPNGYGSPELYHLKLLLVHGSAVCLQEARRTPAVHADRKRPSGKIRRLGPGERRLDEPRRRHSIDEQNHAAPCKRRRARSAGICQRQLCLPPATRSAAHRH